MPGNSGERPRAGANPVAAKPAAAHANAVRCSIGSPEASMPAMRMRAKPIDVAMVAVLV